MEKCFDDLLKLISQELCVQPQDKVGFSFVNVEHEKLNFNISFRRFDQYSSELILSLLDNVLQSNINFLLDDSLVINADHIRIPVGCGRRSHVGKSNDNFFKIHKNFIFTPKLRVQDGNICLPVAIIIGKAYADGCIAQNLYNFLTYPGNIDELVSTARTLANDAGVNYENGCGIDEIRKFEEFLSNEYNLTVYGSRDGRFVYYKSRSRNSRHINLLLDNNHYSVIKSLTAVFASSYFCSYCAKPYTTKFEHKKCPFKCNRCLASPPCEGGVQIKCLDCNRIFLNANCFDNHIKSYVCLKIRICNQCTIQYTFDKKKPHVCGTKFCNTCKKIMPVRHECFIPIGKPKSHNRKLELFIFFDFECCQSTYFSRDETKRVHIPNLCVSHQVCGVCDILSDIQMFCFNCGVREQIFSEENVVDKFMTYLGEIEDKFRKVTIIAHNLQKYDGHFLLQYMYQNDSVWALKEESLVMNGSKILQIRCGRYRFIDSLNFFSVPLSKLPSMFSLNCSSKGYYPHFFNTPENFNYIGSIPDVSFYGSDSMKEDERSKFLEWYNVRKTDMFDNKKELIGYCIQDVNILRLACLEFRSLLYILTAIDPFDQITIAGTCMAIFKSNFLEEDQIAIIPSNGYRLRDNQSIKALKWLEWISHVHKIKIITANNSREIRLAHDIVVDGFYNNTVYEFLGCYWHQCPKCFPIQHHSIPNNKREIIHSRYESTLMRLRKIEKLGYKLITIWEHEFDENIQSNIQMMEYIESIDSFKIDPLEPRDAFFGGRTGVCKLYHKVSGDEKILYYDVTSLYPYVNKYCEYPIGVPKVLIGNELKSRTVFNINGIIKCRVLPPKELYHPVLPIKMHSKLLFVLCYKCAIEKNNDSCIHNDDERMFNGTYVAEELRVAVEKGYEILELYEAWEYKTTKYDPLTKSGGLFAEYIDTFLKIKTEASGYPSWCKTDDEKEEFIRLFHEKEGIQLTPENMIKNSGLRSLAKLCLNSIWGKFGQRPDKTKKMFINERDQLLNLVTNPSYETQSLFALSSESVLASYKLIHNSCVKQPNVNVVIAAYTTAHARIHLYKYLDHLQERAIYHDTDSVIFIKKENDSTLPLGDYLGDLTDEIAEYGENSFIEEVVISSEKSYSFIVKSPNENRTTYVCKVKGISLNYEKSNVINFESMKKLVLTPQSTPDDIIKVNSNVILRTDDSTVYTAKQEYKFKVNANKRRRIGCEKILTLPYGYNECT